ncbi:MAG: hypothetical protein ACYC2H_07120 [Thermoplasmatota archaeon]
MRAWWLPLSLCLLMPGCAEDATPAAEVERPAVVVQDPWMSGDRVTVLDWHAETQEFDALCAMGGAAFPFDREGPVPSDTHHLELTVSMEGTFTGVQAGYSTDGGDTITWLSPVREGPETFQIPVEASQWEDPVAWEEGDDVWSFHHQMNLPEPATQDCYTGFADGRWDIVVEAIKGA